MVRRRSAAKSTSRMAAPDGGDGGRGGSIYAEADENINTLIDYRYARIHRAQRAKTGVAPTIMARAATTWCSRCR